MVLEPKFYKHQKNAVSGIFAMSTAPVFGATTRVPFRAGSLAGDLSSLRTLRLSGSRCRDCGIAFLGERHRCENCSSKNLVHEAFAAEGTVYTYTIQRHPPPPPNAYSGPWSPRPLAWIDLDDGGPRVLGPIVCAPDEARIGSRVRLVCDVDWIDGEGREVVAYKFVIADPATDR